MKRMHVHVSVTNLEDSVRFYSTLFASKPTVEKPDYAKWMLDDPRVNFVIQTHGTTTGLDHLGIQVDDDSELAEVERRLVDAARPVHVQTATTCCYAKSNKAWTADPEGIAWETFHTFDAAETYGTDSAELPAVRAAAKASSTTACCGPQAA